jgi:hypothetical protein
VAGCSTQEQCSGAALERLTKEGTQASRRALASPNREVPTSTLLTSSTLLTDSTYLLVARIVRGIPTCSLLLADWPVARPRGFSGRRLFGEQGTVTLGDGTWHTPSQMRVGQCRQEVA